MGSYQRACPKHLGVLCIVLFSYHRHALSREQGMLAWGLLARLLRKEVRIEAECRPWKEIPLAILID